MKKRVIPQGEQRRSLFLEMFEALEDAFGPMNWWPAETRFEVCIGAILTQNAPWSGVVKSITNLKEQDLFDAHAIAEAPENVLADAVNPSIYYNQKAKRLKIFCRFLMDNLSGKIENLSRSDKTEARETLLAIEGIGPETADSILLYALNMPYFVVDAYTRRIFSRHGLVDPAWDYYRLQAFFEDVLERDNIFYGEFHALLCILGAKICKRKPDCDKCPVRNIMGEPLI